MDFFLVLHPTILRLKVRYCLHINCVNCVLQEAVKLYFRIMFCVGYDCDILYTAFGRAENEGIKIAGVTYK